MIYARKSNEYGLFSFFPFFKRWCWLYKPTQKLCIKNMESNYRLTHRDLRYCEKPRFNFNTGKNELRCKLIAKLIAPFAISFTSNLQFFFICQQCRLSCLKISTCHMVLIFLFFMLSNRHEKQIPLIGIGCV